MKSIEKIEERFDKIGYIEDIKLKILTAMIIFWSVCLTVLLTCV